MTRWTATVAAALLSCSGSSARAGDLAVGVGLGVGADLPDRVSKDYARFGPGPGLLVPIWWEAAPAARLRATVRTDVAWGSDRVTWSGGTVGGDEVRLYDDDHLAVLVASSVTVGGEVVIPTGSAGPYLGVELGVAWIGTFHSLAGETAAALLDPDQNDLGNPANIDPYTGQAAWRSDVHAGVEPALSERVSAFVEVGYSIAFAREQDLRKTPVELDARRAPYGYNALRAGVGLAFRH